MELTPKQQRRFWSAVAISEKCWEWNGYRDRHGYGVFWASNRNFLAHRVAYELVKGQIPDGLCLDHLCRNRACVKPAHLEAVTLRENILRGNEARGAGNRKTHCPKGHEYTPDNTYVSPSGKRNCKTCRREGMRAARGSTSRERLAGPIADEMKGART